METKAFDISTEEGLLKAEKYQQRLYSKYNRVTVIPSGVARIIIIGSNRP